MRAQLGRGLPDFHEVKLFQGTRELVDDAVVELELQAVFTPSPGMVVTELHAASSKGFWDRATEVIAALQDLRDLEPAHCEEVFSSWVG